MFLPVNSFVVALQKAVWKERISKEHGELIRKLCGMANNLNQLARKANAEGYASVFVTCRALMIEIDNLVNRIRL